MRVTKTRASLVETSGSSATPSARGTDLIERTTGGTTQTCYPLYDAHGNSVATLGRPATTGALPSLGDERSYDAWGRVRLGLQTGAPSARYCASLGHVQDDESGLTYMRARYYEASTGRFLSEDKAWQGKNWYVYCGSNPVNRVDESGNSATEEVLRCFLYIFHGLDREKMPAGTALRLLEFLQQLIDNVAEAKNLEGDVHLDLAEAAFQDALAAPDTFNKEMGMQIGNAQKSLAAKCYAESKLIKAFGTSFVNICRALVTLDDL